MHTRADRQHSARPSKDDSLPTPGKAPLDDPGRPLPSSLRVAMEESFQTDFSDVRVREGGLAEELGAIAVARGDTIDFARGAFDPDSASGREVIGHELAHVVQQRQGRVTADAQAKGLPTSSDPGLEAEADTLGHRAARGEVVAQAWTPATGASGPAQFLRKDKDTPDPIAIDSLGYDECVYYLKEAASTGSAVVFEDGDVAALRRRLGDLRGGSVFDQASRDGNTRIATEVLLNPGEVARTDDKPGKVRLGEVVVGGDPIDCGTTAKLLGEVFLGEGADEQQRHNSLANRKAEQELGIVNTTTNANPPTKQASEIGMLAGTNADFGELAKKLLDSPQPCFIQMSVKSVPPALGHTFVLEVFGRRGADEPVLGKVHQSFVNTYPLHAWLGDPKNGVIDVIAYLVELGAMCADSRMDTYFDKFLISKSSQVATAKLKRNEFEHQHKATTYSIGISFSAQPFDPGQAKSRLDARVPADQVKAMTERIEDVFDLDDY